MTLVRSTRNNLRINDLEDVPLILPSLRTRPYSYNLTMQLFRSASLQPRIVQQIDELCTEDPLPRGNHVFGFDRVNWREVQ